jgi:hypothetical protein
MVLQALVFQKIGLATAATVLVGESSLRWETFVAALYWIGSEFLPINESTNTSVIDKFETTNIEGFLSIASGIGRNAWGLLAYLELTQKLTCSDLRDRLYAIRSLLHPKDRKLISPDYSKDVRDVYKTTVLQWIAHTGNLNLIRRCLLHEPASMLDLPTWVSDLSFQNLQYFIFSSVMASGRTLAVVSHQKVDDILAVHGVKIARITKISSSSVEGSHTDSQILAICRSWMSPKSESTSYLNGSSMLDAFIETLTFGELWTAFPGDWLSLEKLKTYLQEFGVNGRNKTMDIKNHKISRAALLVVHLSENPTTTTLNNEPYILLRFTKIIV